MIAYIGGKHVNPEAIVFFERADEFPDTVLLTLTTGRTVRIQWPGHLDTLVDKINDMGGMAGVDALWDIARTLRES